jgi:Ca-activated chloride channel family protein
VAEVPTPILVPTPPVDDTKPDGQTTNIPKQVAPKQRLEGQYIPNNAVFLLDVSSSMGQSNKLPLMRTAIRRALPRFFRRDKISIITFANNPRVLLNGIAGDQGKSIQLTLTGLEIGGTTEGKPALTEALRSAEAHYIEGGQNLVIWATDAKLKLRELKPLARQLKKKKIDLVMLVYGRPDKEIDSDISRYTEEADGRYRWIQAENIDQVLEEILKLDRRKQ